MSKSLEALVVVGTEVELEIGSAVAACKFKVCLHLGTAVHKVVGGAVLWDKVNCKLPVREVLRSAHYGAEELLLESEPLYIVVETLRALAAVADVLRLFVVREIVVKTGVLGLVLVAFLKTWNNSFKIYGNAP